MPRHFPDPLAKLYAVTATSGQVPEADANGDYTPDTPSGGITSGTRFGDAPEWDGDSYEPQAMRVAGTYHRVLSSTVEEWGSLTRFSQLASGVDVSSGMATAVANGGSAARINAATMLAASGTFFHSGLSLATGTTNNNTGVAGVLTFADGIVGIPTPVTAGETKYQFEAYIRTGTNVVSSSTNGVIRVGFLGSTTATPTNGMWFEFRYDGTTNDTTWHLVNRKDGGQTRNACMGTSLAANTEYRLKLVVTRATNGDVTQDWTINGSTGTVTTANANLSTDDIPYDTSTSTGDAFGIGMNVSKAGSATASSHAVDVAYFAFRIVRTFAPAYQPSLWSS